jgi:hypothetical protein
VSASIFRTLVGCVLGVATLGCLSTEGYYRNAETGGEAGNAGNAGTTGNAGTNGNAGSVGTNGSAGSVGTTGGAGTVGTTGGAGTVGTTSHGGTTGSGTGGTTGTGGTVASGTVMFMDNFEEATAPSQWLSGDKDTGTGTWTVVTDNTKVFQGTASSSTFTEQVSGNTAWTDMTVESDVKIMAGSGWEVGLTARFTTYDSYYIMFMDDSGQVQVRRRMNGSTTTLGTKSKGTVPAAGTASHFKLDIHGTNITATVDGVVRVTTSDAGLASGGFGLAVSDGTAEFDNVVVTK